MFERGNRIKGTEWEPRSSPASAPAAGATGDFHPTRNKKIALSANIFVSFGYQTGITMKKVLLILLFSTGIVCTGAAQNIVLGERVPELKAASWLDDRQPAPAPMTYIEFFHSSNPSCITSIKRLKALVSSMDQPINIVVVTKEDAEKVASLVKPLLGERIYVALHADRGFEIFGVAYVPSGVLIGPKNRALWMGNSLQFNKRIIEQSIQ